MTKLSFSFAGAAVVGSFVVVACVGDDSAVTSSGPGTQGMLDSACFANGTCSDGLSCTVVLGNAKCVPPGDAAAAADGSSIADASTADVAEAAPSACVITPTPYACKPGGPTLACYGAISSCAWTSCDTNVSSWQCLSTMQCDVGNPCCLSTAQATLSAGASCAQGTLAMATATAMGAT